MSSDDERTPVLIDTSMVDGGCSMMGRRDSCWASSRSCSQDSGMAAAERPGGCPFELCAKEQESEFADLSGEN